MNYRLTIYPAMEDSSEDDQSYTSFMFETKEELIASHHTAADLLLFMQDKMGVMPPYSNLFVASEKIGNEWFEIDDF